MIKPVERIDYRHLEFGLFLLRIGGRVGIVFVLDMSKTSMDIAKERAKVRRLENITWIHDSLLNIPTLKLGLFDYINCSGVLHHLENPDLGLQILSSSLKEDGAMGLMVYAKYGRMAVYQMQEALRLINGLEENAHVKVANCKAILANLPTSNWLHASPPGILSEMQTNDARIYDLLLHSQDRAYSIPELYAFTNKAGLGILDFFSDNINAGNNLYNPACYIKDPALEAKVGLLPLQEQQALAELLNGKIYKHTFYAAKKIPVRPDPEDPDNIPLLGEMIYGAKASIHEAICRGSGTITLRHKNSGTDITFLKTPHLEAIFQHIDGKSSIGEIIEKILDGRGNPAAAAKLSGEFKALFTALHPYGWIFLRHKSTPLLVAHEELQERVKRMHA